jgi:hypothetical protein
MKYYLRQKFKQYILKWDAVGTIWFQKRRLLNNFPIRSYVKIMSADGGHFEPRSGSLNTILEVDHLRTIDDMFAILAY